MWNYVSNCFNIIIKVRNRIISCFFVTFYREKVSDKNYYLFY